MLAAGQKKINFATKVMEVFTEVQKNTSIHKTHIFQLIKYSREDFQLFMYSFEQAYLKIFQSFHSKANKKIPTKFQNLAESFFEAALSKKVEQDINSQDSRKVIQIFNSFLALCSQGIYSTIMNIRVMCCRMVFQLVKQIPPKKMELYLKQQVQEALINATLHILRTKVSTYRQLGVKLASLILHFNSPKCESIEKQMFKILAVEDNEQIRKMVITNLSISKSNLQEILIRLRDKNPQIRSIVAKKLQGQKFKLQDMTISNLYKLLYDGYGSKEINVKKQCLRYFSLYFLQEDNSMVDESNNRHRQFVKMFRPQILLLNPHLYYLFDQLIYDLLEQLQASMKDYVHRSCQQLKKGNLTFQIIWLKNAINSKSRQIVKVYEQREPTGVDLAKVLVSLSQKNQAFAVFQILQLFARQKMPDQIGRNKMFDALKTLLFNLKYFELKPDYSNFRDTDICHILDKQQLNRKKLMLSYYDMPIISNSLDLIFQIGEAMKSLRPEHYEIQMKQVMSQWHNPEQNTKMKDKEIIQGNINKIKTKGQNDNVLIRLKAQLKEVEEQIEQDAQKTRKVLMCISRLRYNCDLQIFMSIIKEQLSKDDKANGLLLLGLYCLQNNDKVTTFWNVFWQYISSTNVDGHNKNHLLVSLKVVIDFIVKFNCLSGQFAPEGMQQFNADMFMNQMVRLMLHEDPDIKILAIQSLCRLLYHERVDKSNESTYFLYLILLWLQTSTEIVSAKSVHTVSIFIKSYIQKGNSFSLKLAEVFCLFFKVLTEFESQKKTINKQLITYNLTMEEFIKKTLFTVLTIFKYQKQSKSVIWTYNPLQNEIGPQQFILLYLIKDHKMMGFLGKSISQCDFFEFCGLQTLIIVKKVLQQVNQTKKLKGNTEQTLKKLEQDIERQIALKKTETFNQNVVQQMQRLNSQQMKLLNEEARYIHKNIEQKNLFIRLESEDSYEGEDNSQQQQVSSVSSSSSSQSQQQRNLSEQGPVDLKKRKKAPVIQLSEDQQLQSKQDESKQEIKQNEIPKKTKRQTKQKLKKQMPVAPIRNLRKRK